jgi:hypothetical protein
VEAEEVGLGVGLRLQGGLTQGVCYESGAELGLVQPYGKPHGLFAGPMENPYGSALSGEIGGRFGGRTPPWALTNGSPLWRHVSPGALAACLPGAGFLATESPPSVTSGQASVCRTIRSPSRRGSLPAWRGAQDRELRTDELWRLLRAHIRCMPLIHFSDTLDLTQRINFDHSFGEASRLVAFRWRIW